MSCLKECTLILLICFAVFSGSNAQEVPLNAKVRTGKLKNGFTYYIRKNPEPAKRVTMYLVNKVGSILETEEERGLAHFLEHMAFNGTRHFPKNELINYLQRSGVRFGADLNAYTGFEETVYQLPFPSDDPALFRNALQIMRDWAGDISLDGEEIEKERGIVLEERRQRLGAQQRIQEKMMPLLFNHAKYSNRLPIGTEDVIKNFSHETLRNFYRKWYRPDLQALIVVGDVNEKQVERMITAMFSDLKKPSTPVDDMKEKVTLNGKDQFQVITDPEEGAAVIHMFMKHYSDTALSWDYFRNAMIRGFISDILTSRLNDLNQQPDVPFAQVSNSFGPLVSNISSLNFSIVVKPGKTGEGFKSVWTELERIRRHGFVPGELLRAKANFLAGIEGAYKERDNAISDVLVKEYVRHFLNREPSPGIEAEYRYCREQIDAVSIEEVNAAMEKYLKQGDRDFIFTAKDSPGEDLPDEMKWRQWLQDIARSDIKPYVDKGETRVLLAEKPVPGKIVDEQPVREAGVTKLTLSNGVTVLLKPTSFKKDEVLIGAYSRGGLSMVSDSDYHAAVLVPGIVANSGVGSLDATALKQYLAGRKVRFAHKLMPYSESITGTSGSDDLEVAMQLLYLYLTRPRWDANVLKNLVTGYSLSLNSSAGNPMARFMDTVIALSHGYHMRVTKPLEAQLQQIRLEQVAGIYKQRFEDTEGFSFVFTGSFDPEKIKPLIEQYIGALPVSRTAPEPVVDRGDRPVQGNLARKVHMGKENKAFVMLMFNGEYEPANALEDDILIRCMAAILKERLIARLREEESGIYNIHIDSRLKILPGPEHSTTISFTCDPANVELLILSLFSEIEKLKTDGPDQSGLEKCLAAEKQGYRLALRDNNAWFQYLLGSFQNRNDLNDFMSVPAMYQKVTPAAIRGAAVKYLESNNYKRFVLLPENQ